MLRISILFGLLAFASAVKKVIGANIHNIASIFFTAFNAINGGFLFNDDILWCFSVHVSLQKKNKLKIAGKHWLLHFHIHNSFMFHPGKTGTVESLFAHFHFFSLSISTLQQNWPNLKTTWGLNPFGAAFASQPRTQSEAASAGWWFGFDFLKIFYCFFCLMVICFWFFENILLLLLPLLLDGDLLLIIWKYFIVAASASAGWWGNDIARSVVKMSVLL